MWEEIGADIVYSKWQIKLDAHESLTRLDELIANGKVNFIKSEQRAYFEIYVIRQCWFNIY